MGPGIADRVLATTVVAGAALANRSDGTLCAACGEDVQTPFWLGGSEGSSEHGCQEQLLERLWNVSLPTFARNQGGRV